MFVFIVGLKKSFYKKNVCSVIEQLSYFVGNVY